MSIDSKIAELLDRQDQRMVLQEQQMAELTKLVSVLAASGGSRAGEGPLRGSTLSIDAIEARIQEFVYEPEMDRTFERWWSRHEDIFKVDLKDWEDVKRVRLLLRHMSPREERLLGDKIAAKTWSEITRDEAVRTL